MSRIGKKPVTLPKGVDVSTGANGITVKGPKGSLTQSNIDRVSVAVEDGKIIVTRQDDSKESRSRHGLMRALLQNLVTGVTEGYEKKLAVVGVGYRADVQGRELVLNVGYSHPVHIELPQGIDIEVDRNNNISVRGIDKVVVGEVSARIRRVRPPDAYKGKGIRYADEHIKLKLGKAAGAR